MNLILYETLYCICVWLHVYLYYVYMLYSCPSCVLIWISCGLMVLVLSYCTLGSSSLLLRLYLSLELEWTTTIYWQLKILLPPDLTGILGLFKVHSKLLARIKVGRWFPKESTKWGGIRWIFGVVGKLLYIYIRFTSEEEDIMVCNIFSHTRGFGAMHAPPENSLIWSCFRWLLRSRSKDIPWS